MKSMICKNPVISVVVINIITFIMCMYAISERAYAFTILIMVVAIVNRQIIEKGQNIDKQKKTTMFISFFLIVIIQFAYAMYKIYANH
ncbi:hypothetical protein LL037_12670 [Clostridium estertheticum]|uniref:hypothetical protein n=1 Tax=Clostridium estertheticum TaxID=238834 RepID=UPI001C0DE64F|nr:hypothetical protein [Clostridium estertheticum]MBU3200928.1 hypothetical protein [Clostridium estertheticum]WAG67933.1 hypothetical protein LL037_12670 [Clostridium estertheticum]